MEVPNKRNGPLPRLLIPAVLAAQLTVSFMTVSASALANSPPFIAPLDNQSISVGQQLRVRIVPGDPDGDVPGLRIVNYPTGALFSDNGDGTRSFAWVPTQSDIGLNEFIFEAFDATDVDLIGRRTLRVTVASANTGNDGNPGNNLPPEIESLTDQSVRLGGQFNFRVVPIDPEGVVPSLRVQPLPEGASFSDNQDGTRQFVWQPGLASPGSVELAFTTQDAQDPSLSSTRRITLRIQDANGNLLPGMVGSGDPSNRAPLFGSLPNQDVALGQQFEFIVRPIDLDGDVPGLAIDRLPAGASFTDNFDGSRTFRWRPLPINLGDTFVTFSAIDANEPQLRTRQSVRLRVFRDPNSLVNFAPRINGIRNPLIRIGDTLNQLVQPVDPDFTVPSLRVLNPPAGASFDDNGDGGRTCLVTTRRRTFARSCRSTRF